MHHFLLSIGLLLVLNLSGSAKNINENKTWENTADFALNLNHIVKHAPPSELTREIQRLAFQIPAEVAKGYDKESSDIGATALHKALQNSYALESHLWLAARSEELNISFVREQVKALHALQQELKDLKDNAYIEQPRKRPLGKS
ncbi:MAG: four helix bundle protein [Mangrovibacterium sp.]